MKSIDLIFLIANLVFMIFLVFFLKDVKKKYNLNSKDKKFADVAYVIIIVYVILEGVYILSYFMNMMKNKSNPYLDKFMNYSPRKLFPNKPHKSFI